MYNIIKLSIALLNRPMTGQVDEECKVTLIDFPQMVPTSHRNAQELFDRDVACITRFFSSKLKFISEGRCPDFKVHRSNHVYIPLGEDCLTLTFREWTGSSSCIPLKGCHQSVYVICATSVQKIFMQCLIVVRCIAGNCEMCQSRPSSGHPTDCAWV